MIEKRKTKKRNSTHGSEYRELPDGARQQRRSEELAVELLVETDFFKRKEGVDTVGVPPLEGKGIRNLFPYR